MDEQWDGTDVCPLREDERRIYSFPWETQSGPLTEQGMPALDWEIDKDWGGCRWFRTDGKI